MKGLSNFVLISSCIFLTALSEMAFGQKGQIGLKLSNNFDFFETTIIRYNQDYSEVESVSLVNSTNLYRPCVGIQWNSMGNLIHEVQLSYSGRPSIYNRYVPRSTGSDVSKVHVSLGYLMDRIIHRHSGHFTYSFGMGAILYHYVVLDHPPALYFNTLEYNSGVYFGILPKMEYSLSRNLSLELRMILNVVDLRYHQFHVANPQISPEERNVERSTALHILPKHVGFSLGISYLITAGR